VIIQGSYIAAKAAGNFSEYAQYRPQMVALLTYWETQRKDKDTGLYTWHDQMETGADNLVYMACPSPFSPDCWDEASMANTLASPDLQTFMVREHTAFALFLQHWAAAAEQRGDTEQAAADRATAAQHRALADAIGEVVNRWLWHEEGEGAATRGWYAAYNVSTKTPILNRTYQMAWPLWANLSASAGPTEGPRRMALAVAAILEPDMRTGWGVRSTSNLDPRYSNANIITPYSEWRGPHWINVNSVLAYTMARCGYQQEAAALAQDITALLAADLRATGVWHENYSADTGLGLASPGFLSWNMMGATLLDDITNGRFPFDLDY
jgi:hypothetical protein